MKSTLFKKTKGKRSIPPKAKSFHWTVSKKERFILLLPAIAIAALCAITLHMGHYFTDYTLQQPGYQYYGGGEFLFREGTLLRHTDNLTKQIQGEAAYEVSTLPLYMEDGTLLLPNTMVFWDVGLDYVLSAEYFTNVAIDQYEQVLFSNGDKEKTFTGGILYDGNDLYVFLEPMTLKFNSRELTLPAFSYVEVSATEDLMLYDSHWGEFYTETPRTNVIATSSNGDYTVSLIGDTVQPTVGTMRMLPSNPTALNSLF